MLIDNKFNHKTVTALSCLLLLLLILSGCAREVTDKNLIINGSVVDTSVRDLELSVNLRGSPAWPVKYYFIFSVTNNIKTVAPANLPSAYFFAPGESFTEQGFREAYYTGDVSKNLQDVYNDYFFSWDQYLVLDTAVGYNFSRGPFVSSANHSLYLAKPIYIADQSSATTIKFRISLDYFNSGQKIYFNILAVDGENQILKDYVDAGCNIDLVNQAEKTEYDIGDPALSPAYDILSWQGKIYVY